MADSFSSAARCNERNSGGDIGLGRFNIGLGCFNEREQRSDLGKFRDDQC